LHEPKEKRRRLEHPGIQHFFSKKEVSIGGNNGDSTEAMEHTHENGEHRVSDSHSRHVPITNYVCSRCNAELEDSEALQSHMDWHMAKDLHDQERGKPEFASSKLVVPRGQKNANPTPHKKPSGSGSNSSAGGAGGKRLEQGQSRLKFG
jgi:DNA polymerase eta